MMEGPWCRVRREARARSDIDTGVVDSLKALDPERPIREADIADAVGMSQMCHHRKSVDFSITSSFLAQASGLYKQEAREVLV